MNKGSAKGGLAFLNKKNWHTARIQNIEKVWLAEQKAKQEEQRMKELQKKLEEERAIEELRRVQAAAGLISQAQLERLEWMYQGGPSAQETAEEYLLGKEWKPKPEEEDIAKLSQRGGNVAGSLFLQSTANPELEAENRIREDPLTAIMKAEQLERQRVLKNPIKMREIRERTKEEQRLLEKLMKEAKKRKKRDKKAKKKRSRSRSRSSSSSPSRSRSRSRSRSPAPSSSSSSSSFSSSSPAPADPATAAQRRYGLILPSSVTAALGSNVAASQQQQQQRGRSRSPPRRGRDRSRSRSRSRERESDRGRSRRSRSRDRDRGRGRRRSRSRSRERERDSTSTSSSSSRFEVRLSERKARILAANPPPQRTGPLKLSEEERQRRLAEMMAAGEQHDALQREKLAKEREKAKKEEEEYLQRAGDERKASFIHQLNASIYTGSSSETVEDRLNKYRHYRQKGNVEHHEFLKRG